MRPLRELFGHLPVVEVGPQCLKTLQQHFVAEGLTRKEVNRRSQMVKRMFKWLAGEELVPVTLYHALATVEGLRRGRSTAAESEPVRPVADAVVEATLPILTRYVAAMVRFQRLTGCRPGEVCRFRMADVTHEGGVWIYWPPQHKGTHRGKTKIIAVGPTAQTLVAPFLPADPGEYVFSPAKAVEEVRQLRSAGRTTPRFASHMEQVQRAE